MYKINLEDTGLIDRLELPVLVVKVPKHFEDTKQYTVSLEEQQGHTILKDDVVIWLKQNIKGTYQIRLGYIEFEDEDDATLFKLTWI